MPGAYRQVFTLQTLNPKSQSTTAQNVFGFSWQWSIHVSCRKTCEPHNRMFSQFRAEPLGTTAHSSYKLHIGSEQEHLLSKQASCYATLNRPQAALGSF